MKSQEASGYFLNQLPIGSRLTVQTRNSTYDIEIRRRLGKPDKDWLDTEVWIKGHHYYCPDWTKIDFYEPFWVGVGAHMEWFSNPAHGKITTSAIERVTCRSNLKPNDDSCMLPIQR